MNLPIAPPVTTEAVSAVAIALTWVSSFFGYVPIAAAVLVSVAGTVYYILVIYTHPTIREWLQRRREQKILKLKSKLLSRLLVMARRGNGEQAFWETIATESQKIMTEIEQHHRHEFIRSSLLPKLSPIADVYGPTGTH